MSSARRLFLLLATLAAALACVAATTSAETISLPSAAASGTSLSDQLDASACPAAGDCVAVGGYVDSSDVQQGLVDSESNGTWATSEVNLSGLSPGGDANGYLDSVACTSAGNCVAVGQYANATGHETGLIDSESNGTWTASAANLGSLSTGTTSMTYLDQVSCSSTGNCVAVGDYNLASTGREEALLETETNGTWTASEANLSAISSVAVSPAAYLASVACSSPGNCAAIGGYDDASGNQEGLLETETNGSWAASEANLAGLSRYSGGPNPVLSSVSCPSAGDCTAVGQYITGAGSEGGLLVTEQNGAWQAATQAGLPVNASPAADQSDLSLNSVSCSSPGNCIVVGDYDATSIPTAQAVALTEIGGDWETPAEIGLPTAGAGSSEITLTSVYCETNAVCTAAGTYLDANNADQEIIAQRSATGTWFTANIPVSTGSFVFGTASVSCSSGGYCVTAGYAGVNAFLFDAPATVAAPSVSASGTQATVSWAAPSDNGGLAVSGYSITANDLTSPGRGGQTVTTPSAMTIVTLTGLTPGDSYRFTIVPMSLLGTGLSAASGTVTVPAPAPISAVAGPTTAKLSASLSRLLAPKGTASRIKKLRKTHSFTFSYRSLESGRVLVDWYEITGKRKHRKRHLVAAGSARTSGAHTAKVKVRFTALGRRLIKSHRKLRLTADVTFTSGKTKLTRAHSFTLH